MAARGARWSREEYNNYMMTKRIEEERAKGKINNKKVPSRAALDERSLQKSCEHWLNERGLWWKHDRRSKGERIGIPDLIICFEGLLSFIQTLRLHWVEWFLKFYSGDGYEYKPLAIK